MLPYCLKLIPTFCRAYFQSIFIDLASSKYDQMCPYFCVHQLDKRNMYILVQKYIVNLPFRPFRKKLYIHKKGSQDSLSLRRPHLKNSPKEHPLYLQLSKYSHLVYFPWPDIHNLIIARIHVTFLTRYISSLISFLWYRQRVNGHALCGSLSLFCLLVLWLYPQFIIEKRIKCYF